MGLFSSNYNRPGPGVRKDAPKKKAVPRFFEIFFRKFWELVKLNLIFMVPVVVVVLLVFLLGEIVRIKIGILVFLPLILLGPFTAGLAYNTRNYVREEHAFVLSDFWDAVKNNWKAFLLNGLLCYSVYIVMSIAVPYYFGETSKSAFFFLPLAVCMCATLLFIFTEFYVPIMLVTFDMKLGQVLKNGLIFAIVGLWRNLLTAVILIVVAGLWLIGGWLIPLIQILGLFWIVFLAFSFTAFLVNFSAYPIVDRYMIKPQQTEPEQEEDSEFKDTHF